MPFWLIALALAGGGYYLYSRNNKGGGFISANEYVDKKGVHWMVTKSGETWAFDTKGYGGDAGIRGQDQAAVIASVESHAANNKPV